jgi:hypothetical protein
MLWDQSFGRSDRAKRAIAARGWGPLNYKLLDHPKLFGHDVIPDNNTNHPNAQTPSADVSQLLVQKAINNSTDNTMGDNNIILSLPTS